MVDFQFLGLSLTGQFSLTSNLFNDYMNIKVSRQGVQDMGDGLGLVGEKRRVGQNSL